MGRVIVSTGHTPDNPGKVINGIKEYDLNKRIADALVEELRSNGILTLSAPLELDLATKIQWINGTTYLESNDDMCIEIHSNSSKQNKSGLEIWFSEEGKNKSQKLAESIIEKACNETSLPNQGAHSEYNHEIGGLAFVHNNGPIAVLMECGYMDNPKDQKFLSNDQNLKKLVIGISKGVLSYLDIDYSDKYGDKGKSKQIKPQTQQKKKENDSNEKSQKSNKKENTSKTQQTKDDNSNKSSKVNSNNVKSNAATSDQSQNDNLKNIANTGTVNTLNSKINKKPSRMNTNTNQTKSSVSSNTSARTNSIGSSSSSSSKSAGGSYLESREKRKEMIKQNYIKILGREPNQSDQNYFLNIGINEDQLIKKMIDSQEHADLVKARHEVLEVKAKFHAQQAELIALRAESEDKTELMEHFQRLITQKNQGLTQMQYRINQLEQALSQRSQVKEITDSGPKYNEPFMQKLFKFFSDRLG